MVIDTRWNRKRYYENTQVNGSYCSMTRSLITV
jgi:hypothetical protein